MGLTKHWGLGISNQLCRIHHQLGWIIPFTMAVPNESWWSNMGVNPKIVVFPPQIIHFNRVWNHYNPSILGYHYFWFNTHISEMAVHKKSTRFKNCLSEICVLREFKACFTRRNSDETPGMFPTNSWAALAQSPKLQVFKLYSLYWGWETSHL